MAGFRAAAIDQLVIWSQRAGVDIVKHMPNSDPAAVAFDACDAAIARKVDYLILDTAGRLHTQDHLMRELGKITRVVQKRIPDALKLSVELRKPKPRPPAWKAGATPSSRHFRHTGS